MDVISDGKVKVIANGMSDKEDGSLMMKNYSIEWDVSINWNIEGLEDDKLDSLFDGASDKIHVE